jgi:hypothetical protein
MNSHTKNFFKPLLRICEDYLQRLQSWPPWRLLQDAKNKVLNHVNLVVVNGRVVVLSHSKNERHLVGDLFLVLAVVSFFLHQFFPQAPNDKNWYYTNWFYFLRTLRPWMIGFFGTLSILYYWPKKNKSVYIVFTVLHSLCWLGIIHFSFLVDDYDSFHSIPHWGFWVVAISFGIGFVLAADHLVYVLEHKVKGNHKRFVMLAEHKDKIERAELDRMLDNNANEYRKLYTNY